MSQIAAYAYGLLHSVVTVPGDKRPADTNPHLKLSANDLCRELNAYVSDLRMSGYNIYYAAGPEVSLTHSGKSFVERFRKRDYVRAFARAAT